ncbi:hypothetical protein GKZ89_11815 [Bacillus mangrovi]|uniref:YvbJ-like NTF2-like domain-containing protein n=2 Tax=Metabacillus mangrovi TaxID=1491830 RepID=A0A7X2S782_9BACI|nr:hypothetical protein [Metabacillus mangrovi]
MEEKKTEAWGNKQVTVVIDSHKLAREDKDVQKELLAAVDVFNKDMSVFQTSGFDISTLTNVTDEVKEDTSFVQDDFELIKDYVDEMHSQYLGAVVNLDDLNVDSFDKKWSAEVSALVSYNSKLRYREEKTFEDLSYQSVREYSLQYDPKAKKWLIADLMEREAIGSEDEDWDNKKELKVENPPVLKWSRNDESINL